MRKTGDKICNTALFHVKLARPRSSNVRIPMVYFDLLYLSLLLSKQHIKCGPAADCLACRISIKMASQPCGGTIYSQHSACIHSLCPTWTSYSESNWHYYWFLGAIKPCTKQPVSWPSPDWPLSSDAIMISLVCAVGMIIGSSSYSNKGLIYVMMI